MVASVVGMTTNDNSPETNIPDNISEGPSTSPSPTDDLYRHVNGQWLSSHIIPEDRPVDGTFHTLRDQAEAEVREIIEAAAPDSRIGAAWASFMDEAGIEAAGLEPLRADLDLLRGVSSFEELAAAHGALDVVGVGGLAGFYVAKDSGPHQPANQVAYVSQSGLSLPDEAYYRAPQHAPLLAGVTSHIERMLGLVRPTLPELVPAELQHHTDRELAELIIDFETRLAAGQWSVEENRDAHKTYNPTAVEDLPTGYPWATWLRAAHVTADTVIISQPSYLDHVATLASEVGLPTFLLHTAWHILHARAAYLPAAVVAESFDFYGRTLSGQEKQRDRWKRGVGFVESILSEEVGQEFVARHFPPTHKAAMDELVTYLLRAYRQRITALDWMTEDTKTRALAKLDSFLPLIGYPTTWKDYSTLNLGPTGADLLANRRAGSRLAHLRDVNKIGTPAPRDEWICPPQMVNAFYNPVENTITFPAAILRPPFYSPTASPAENFGGIGAVIGHEIGHGFDDQGSHYDGDGAMNSWWTDADRAAFEALTARLVDQFDGLTPLGLAQRGIDGGVNGRFTLGENIGDLGGLGIAVVAYHLWAADHGQDVTATDLRDLFVAWATIWRTAIRPQLAQQYLAIDPHSPAEFRCNMVVRNLDAFHEAFGTQPGDGMWLAPEERVTIW